MHPGHTDSPQPTTQPTAATQPPMEDYRFRVTCMVETSAVITISGPSREAAEAQLRAQFGERDSEANEALAEDARVFFRKHAHEDDYRVEDAEVEDAEDE